MTVAYSHERKFEDAVAGLLRANSEIVELGTTIKTSWEQDKRRLSQSVTVHCRAPRNANLGATGGGAYWSAVVALESMAAMAKDPTNDSLDRLHGACQRFWAALTVSSLNTALSGQSLTVYGIVGVDNEDEQEVDDGFLARSSAVELHYAVT